MKWLWKQRWLKPLVLMASLAPLAVLAWLWWTNQLGINRLEFVARYTGRWALRILLASLAITPLRLIRPLSPLIQFRRMLGLVAFLYAGLHALHYWAVDVGWNWAIVQEDLVYRRFFLYGTAALALMVPLAATSTDGMIRWLGGRRWQALHRLVYVSAGLAVWHYLLQGKGIDPGPLFYAGVLGVLMLVRMGAWWRGRGGRELE